MMLRFLLVLMLLVAGSLMAHAKDAQDPVALIQSIYKSYMGKAEPPDLASLKVYSHRLKALLDADEKAAQGEVGALEFDVFVNGQDWKLSKLKIALISKSEAQAKLRATFNNFKSPEEIILDLVREDGSWRIDEISSTRKGHRWTMSKILSHAPDAFPDEVK
jgi:hypothetical protein